MSAIRRTPRAGLLHPVDFAVGSSPAGGAMPAGLPARGQPRHPVPDLEQRLRTHRCHPVPRRNPACGSPRSARPSYAGTHVAAVVVVERQGAGSKPRPIRRPHCSGRLMLGLGSETVVPSRGRSCIQVEETKAGSILVGASGPEASCRPVSVVRRVGAFRSGRLMKPSESFRSRRLGDPCPSTRRSGGKSRARSAERPVIERAD